MKRTLGARVIATVLAGSVLLAACGGGGAPAAPGAPGGDYKKKMPDLIKPCDDALKELTASVPSVQSGKQTLNEVKAQADAGVAACQASLAAWQGLHMPPPVAQACLAAASARVDEAEAMRSALDHQVSRPYKVRIDRAVDAVTRADAACKAATDK